MTCSNLRTWYPVLVGAVDAPPDSPSESIIVLDPASLEANLINARVPIKKTLQMVLVSPSLWQRLNGPAHHPIAKHFKRQLHGRRGGPPLLALALLAALFLLATLAHIHSRLSLSLIWALPLCFLLHSLICSPQWLHRIVLLISRQGHMEEMSVIPQGRVFIYFLICKLVLRQGDALACLTLLRKLAAAILFLVFVMICFVALIGLESVDGSRLGLLLIEISLLSWLILHEHKQSVVMMCLLPMALSRRLKGQIDGTCLAFASYAALQVMSYMLALVAPLALPALAGSVQHVVGGAAILLEMQLALMLALFMLGREGLIVLLWRAALYQCNAERGLSAQTREPISLQALGARAYSSGAS